MSDGEEQARWRKSSYSNSGDCLEWRIDSVLPEGVSGLSLVADYPRELASLVAMVNRTGKGGPPLRVRMAIHHGAVAPGRFGPVGTAPVVISRLVDAEIVRQQLRQRSDLDIALIFSATVYDEVIQSRLCDLNPEAFRRVAIKTKGITYVDYLYRDIIAPPDSMISVQRRQHPMWLMRNLVASDCLPLA